MTATQQSVVEKLQRKGWIDPWHYGQSVFLFLPDVKAKRDRGAIYRSYIRSPVRVTPTGRILAGYGPNRAHTRN